jgi:hypothetical protein
LRVQAKVVLMLTSKCCLTFAAAKRRRDRQADLLGAVQGAALDSAGDLP